jgi:hypothetical protein
MGSNSSARSEVDQGRNGEKATYYNRRVFLGEQSISIERSRSGKKLGEGVEGEEKKGRGAR